jgi:hypothetical protein
MMIESYFELIDNPINKEICFLREEYQRHSNVFEEYLSKKNKEINQLKKENRNIELENVELISEIESLKESYISLKKFHEKIKNKTPVPNGIRNFVLERDNYTCLACGSNENLTVDHILPRSRGGTNKIENLQILCQPCNITKGANTRDYRNVTIGHILKKKGVKL